MELTATEARRLRHDAQLLNGSDLSPTEVVTRAVALQGQDLPGVLRAIAIRSRPGTTLDDVRAAFDAGDLVRSWPMRGTLFATTPAHLATILQHTGERTRRATTRRRAQLELEDALIDRARGILRDALQDRPRTRAETLALWQGAGIATDGGRGYHLLFHLAVEGLIHWGPFSGTEQQLVLTTAKGADPDDLVGVVRGYVGARGPVTADDAAWWLKLPKTLVRQVAARIAELTAVSVEGVPAWVIGDPEVPDPSGVTLVPAFDEWILGYADRSLVASPGMLAAQVPGNNGVFRPAVLVDGVVVGTWRVPPRSAKAPRTPQAELVERTNAATRKAIDRALAAWPHA
ncbi:winged helix DNA-binding domain-containing protein [Microbacterium sp.]|uniref:winged helix DNA-binding domain-containing protein n=1 Tax=Microbacterium sp. TaxID=51671 RepID=UPI002812646E|nr:winged helix DNA-binding domain-containing protein [Microbacterium sp.]